MFICTQQRVSPRVCMCLGERPADLSRKARLGSAERSGCYGDLPSSTSTEKYRMVKERRGVVGRQYRNGRMVNVSQGVMSHLELSSTTTIDPLKYDNGRGGVCFI